MDRLSMLHVVKLISPRFRGVQHVSFDSAISLFVVWAKGVCVY